MGFRDWPYWLKLLGKISLVLILSIVGISIGLMNGIICGLGGGEGHLCSTILPVLSLVFSLGFREGIRLHYLLFRTDYGFFYWAFPAQLIWSLFLYAFLSFVIRRAFSRNKQIDTTTPAET